MFCSLSISLYILKGSAAPMLSVVFIMPLSWKQRSEAASSSNWLGSMPKPLASDSMFTCNISMSCVMFWAERVAVFSVFEKSTREGGVASSFFSLCDGA